MTDLKMSDLKRGTVGYLQEGEGRYSVIIEHVFADGRVLFKDMGMKRSYVVSDPKDFTASQDAYCTIGSYVEPKWDGDSCRCTNYWAEEKNYNVNQPENIRTDAEAWEFVNRMTA